MISSFQFISLFFISVFFLGGLIEKIKIPWIFSALIIGLILRHFELFTNVTQTETMGFLSDLGMYFLLFIIGFELDIKSMFKNGGSIVANSASLVLFNFAALLILFYFIIKLKLIIAALLALSFSTAGEVVLIPILDSHKIVQSKLGQKIIGLGALDDLFELSSFLLVSYLLGIRINLDADHRALFVSIILLALVLIFMKQERQEFKFLNLESLFLFVMFIFFLFISLGDYLQVASLGALTAGVLVKNLIADQRLEFIKQDLRTVCYGLFAPFFFLSIGLETNLNSLLSNFPLIALIFVVAALSKILGSLFLFRNELSKQESILIGTGLSVRFSTGIIILTILYKKALITSYLFSLLVGANILSLFVVPVTFSWMLNKWFKQA